MCEIFRQTQLHNSPVKLAHSVPALTVFGVDGKGRVVRGQAGSTRAAVPAEHPGNLDLVKCFRNISQEVQEGD